MNPREIDENQSIWLTYFGDGIRFLSLTGLALIGSGAFALFLTFTGHFLPHDSQHIGYTAEQLSAIAPNLVKFMFHDRAAFGGALIAMSLLYIWLAEYPLRNGQKWAWNTFIISGISGFGSFLAYIGYGYLDTWHGLATLILLPIIIVGLIRSKPKTDAPPGQQLNLDPRPYIKRLNQHKPGHGLLLFYTIGLILGGSSILFIGMTTVFVPQDLEFIALCGPDIAEISQDLIPVIAHDRAGFGGGLLTIGITTYLIILNAHWSRSLRQTLLISGTTGFIFAIGIHFYIGYTDFIHLLPAYLGATIFTLAILLTPIKKYQSNQTHQG